MDMTRIKYISTIGVLAVALILAMQGSLLAQQPRPVPMPMQIPNPQPTNAAEIQAQIRQVIKNNNAQQRIQIVLPGAAGVQRNVADADPKSVTGASLKTDPELEATLQKADRFRREEQFGIAAQLWQSVLERSGDTLFSTDGQMYYSLAEQVERILAELPRDTGLDAYRITADANAKEILAAANNQYDQSALQQVVRSYFLSSLGDDAAMTLSSIYMDKHDFVGAVRMLEKIANTYPDPSVSLVDVQTRLALCHAMMGESANANRSLTMARQLMDAASEQGSVDAKSSEQLVAVEKSISDISSSAAGRRVEEGFEVALANRNRTGVMPAVPANFMSHDLEAVWQYYFAPKTIRWNDLRRIKPIFGSGSLQAASASVGSHERSMITKWRDYGWRPAGDLLFHNGLVYFKTSIDLSVWDQKADNDQVAWRPLWQNRYELDDSTKSLLEIRRRMHRSRRNTVETQKLPSQAHEFQLFFDRISSQMSIQDGVLYSIEGVPADAVQSTVNNRWRQNQRYNLYARRSRSNRLSAYDATSGRMLWSLPPLEYDDEPTGNEAADEPFGAAGARMVDNNAQPNVIEIEDGSEEDPWIQTGGFMAAPIVYGELVIVPVNHGGAISVYALDPNDKGRTVWKSYLCDESESGANPFSPINLSIDGSDLFASCGLGVVFILDPTTGLIRFAKRYQRAGTVQFQTGSFGQQSKRMDFNSWMTDTVLAFGRQMICFSSDAARIEAYNRNSGESIWWGEAEPTDARVDYLLGVYDGILYAAGPQTLLAFDLKNEGRMLWGGSIMFDKELSLGRGMLTTNGIYIPVGNQIWMFSLEGDGKEPKRLASVNVNLGTGAPVGNLYSDGEKIWVQGANRIYALGRATEEDDQKAGDSE